IGLVLAADNAVALDAIIETMMGCDPARLRFLQKAKEMGLGDYSLDKIEIIGELKPLPDFKLPPLGGDAIIRNENIQAVINSRTILRPQADPDLCTACETCVDQCAVQALSMVNGLPVVDADTCITCFCCQEMCPEKAITLK
ncbi:MAG: 4Fe-4S dicluster domain-containing protein, partial [Thermodesulfobacteriota bacterium]